MRPLWHQP